MFLNLSVIPFLGGLSGRHPLGRRPWADIFLGRHPPDRHPPGQTPFPEMATAADGMHPTGMHSWLDCVSTYMSM